MTTTHSEPQALPWHDGANICSQEVFSSALQELRNVRTHLYQAAQYYEVAYLHGHHQKKAVIESLKEYSAKALVNAVDHVGTVAFHLDESLSQRTAEISAVEIRTACITHRLTTCYGRIKCEGLRESQLTTRRPAYYKHYDPIEMTAEKKPLSLLQLSPGTLAEIFQANAGSDSNTLKSLSWYLAFESSSSATLKRRRRSASLEYRNNSFPIQEHLSRSLSSGQTPLYSQSSDVAVKTCIEDSSSTSKSLMSLMLSDAVEHKEESNLRKNLFTSFLGRNRKAKSKSFDSCKR